MTAREADSSAGRRVFATSDGVLLSVIEAGPAGRSPVVCLVPGWTMPASLWDGQIAMLQSCHRVAALDPRGQGDSEIPAAGYHIDRRADDIAEFVAAYPRVVLVGWSLAALEALHCFGRHRDLAIAGLVLVDSSLGLGRAPSPPRGTAFREALAADRPASMRAFLCDMVRRPWAAQELARLEASVLRMPLQASLDLFPGHLQAAHWRRLLETFTPPLLYAATPQFAEQARTLLERRPATRVEIFENAGHALFLDEPDRFGALLSGFVESLDPAVARRS
ncbi:MAG: alpha/beta fold hydrolase [Burkholderiales bacterium]|nr:alpha/beta fold hydrolase [Burkholderiales bacterium]